MKALLDHNSFEPNQCTRLAFGLLGMLLNTGAFDGGNRATLPSASAGSSERRG